MLTKNKPTKIFWKIWIEKFLALIFVGVIAILKECEL